jgi:hypothetical protein
MMRRLLRQFRRTVVILALLYGAGVWLLSLTLGPRPWAEVRIRLTEDRHYELAGLSPDGRMIATRQGWNGPDGNNVDLTEPNTIWLWDLADFADRGVAPVAVAQVAPFHRICNQFIDSHPNWQRLFWDFVLAADPDEHCRRLLGHRGGFLGDLRLSPDGHYLMRQDYRDPGPTHQAYLVFNRGTPTGQLRIPRMEQLLAIGGDGTWVTTSEGTGPPPQIIIRRREMANGSVSKKTILKGAHRATEQSPDGRWIIAGDEAMHVGGRWIHLNLWVYDAETGERRLTTCGKGIYQFAHHGKTLIDSPDWNLLGQLRFFHLETGEQTGTYHPYVCESITISPDSETVAVTTYNEPDGAVSRWP